MRTTSEPARHMPAPGEYADPATSDIVRWFLDYYWIRHALSRDTLTSWRSDLQSLESWLSVLRHKTLAQASTQDLREFFAGRYKAANGALRDLPSSACIKRFYFFLVEVGVRNDDPTERVYARAPRAARTELTRVHGITSVTVPFESR
jgi:site-specific recombinase XerD